MSFIDKYYAIFNNSVGQHSVTISRAEFANLLGVFSKQEQQLDQLKEQLEAYKMEAEEGKEINAELKAENDTYKKMLEDEDVQLALTEIRSGERHLWFNKAEKYKQTLAEIKEIAEDFGFNGIYEDCFTGIQKILQKISEVEDEA